MKDKRFSIIYDNLDTCCICGNFAEKHEIFYGKNRKNSIKYGLVIPLCAIHHRDHKQGIHFNKKLNDFFKKKGQEVFEEVYKDKDFLKIFGKNYK